MSPDLDQAPASALLNTREVIRLFAFEAAAERAAVEPGAPDPCPWVGKSNPWISAMIARPEHPLPYVPGQGGPGHGNRFDPAAARLWFAEEFERRQSGQNAELITGQESGILMTASTLAVELGIHPTTLVRRLREHNVAVARQVGKFAYYRLSDMLRALTAVAKAEDPDSLPPSDRDAHYRAEARKDALLIARRQLVPVGEAVTVMNALAGVLRDACDLIPDTLESQCALSPAALQHVQREIDGCRSAIAARVRELEAELTTPAGAPPAPATAEALQPAVPA